jgi:hypothetical protein
MGAISGISDVDRPVAAHLLVSHYRYFSEENRRIAVDALLRTKLRCIALLDAIQKKAIAASSLSDQQRQALRKHPAEDIRGRAERVLGPE